MSEETLNDWWKSLSDDERGQARNAFDDEGTSVNISSNVLFHFTDSKEKLISILKNGFYPSYCPEYGKHDLIDVNTDDSPAPAYAYPMVCFCDLPLFLIKKHLIRYGPYGIGMKKRWGREAEISPVLYVHSRSKARESVTHLFEFVGQIDDKVLAITDLVYLIAYSKLYEGKAWRHNRCEGKVRFYNEREWRYVPPLESAPYMFMDPSEYQDANKLKAANAELAREYAQIFVADDVLYTIVRDENEVNDMIGMLRV